MTTDEELILEFQRGAREAFEELFQRYREPVYAFFRRRLNDVARAEELAQETFLAVLRNLARYEPRALFRTYLYAIALHQLAAERRKKAKAEAGSDPALVPATSEDRETVLAVRQALARLDPEEREILFLREYEQLSYSEISSLLQVPLNTVRSRLFRARMALKDLLVAKRGDA